jgi:ATP synthase protein I
MDCPEYRDELSEQVAKKEQRKIKARRERSHSIWYGLGMFGLVGWSVAIPTVVGIAIGIWIDHTWQHDFSCTLICLFVGVAVGCWIAWYWVIRESETAADSEEGSPPNAAGDEQQRR